MVQDEEWDYIPQDNEYEELHPDAMDYEDEMELMRGVDDEDHPPPSKEQCFEDEEMDQQGPTDAEMDLLNDIPFDWD